LWLVRVARFWFRVVPFGEVEWKVVGGPGEGARTGACERRSETRETERENGKAIRRMRMMNEFRNAT
jgi:hypothetical protein